MEDDPLVKAKWKLSAAIAWTGYMVALAIVLVVLGSSLFMFINGIEVPKQLADWGTMCIGFLAMLISQAKEIIKLANETN